MAYKQTPGRSPFLKTGRGIPLNFLSPLHNEGDHKHPHENGVSKDETIPSVTKKTLNITNTGGGESSSNLSTSNLTEYQSGLVEGIPSQGREDTKKANQIVADKKALDIKNKAINEANKSKSSKNVITGSQTANVSGLSAADIEKQGKVKAENLESETIGYQHIADQRHDLDSGKVHRNYLAGLYPFERTKGGAGDIKGGEMGSAAGWIATAGSGAQGAGATVEKSGMGKEALNRGLQSLITGDNPKITENPKFGGPVSGQIDISSATPKEIQDLVKKGKSWRKETSGGHLGSIENKLYGGNLSKILDANEFKRILSASMKKK